MRRWLSPVMAVHGGGGASSAAMPVPLSLEVEEPSLARSASVGRGRPPSEEVQTADSTQKGIRDIVVIAS